MPSFTSKPRSGITKMEVVNGMGKGMGIFPRMMDFTTVTHLLYLRTLVRAGIHRYGVLRYEVWSISVILGLSSPFDDRKMGAM